MSFIEIIMSCVGLLLCTIIFALVCIVILGVVCWIFRTGKDIEIETEEWEEEQ